MRGCSRRCCCGRAFVDFRRISDAQRGAATALALVTGLAGAVELGPRRVAIVSGGGSWPRVIGMRLGRRARDQPADRAAAGRARRRARAARAAPRRDPAQQAVAAVVFTLVAGGLAFLAPQIPGIAAGFAIIWALAWRRQDAAVAAIEERDGACFYVRRTSPVRPMSLRAHARLQGAAPGTRERRRHLRCARPHAPTCCSSRSARPRGCARPTRSCRDSLRRAGARVALARRAAPRAAARR